MQLASLEAKLGGGLGIFDLSPSSFLPPSLSGRNADMTEILLTGSLSLNSINPLLISLIFVLFIIREKTNGYIVYI